MTCSAIITVWLCSLRFVTRVSLARINRRPGHAGKSAMLFSEYMSVIMRIALSIAVFSVFGFGLDAQSPVCEGPPELEKVIRTRPSAGAYDALGAYFGQKQQLTCAILAFESAVRLDPNSWEARFNLSLALLQSEQPARATRELRIAISKRPDEPMGHTALGVALS